MKVTRPRAREAEIVGQGVPPRAIEIGVRVARLLQQRQPHEEVAPDPIEQVLLDGGTKIQLLRQQGDDDQAEGRREQLAADAGASWLVVVVVAVAAFSVAPTVAA